MCPHSFLCEKFHRLERLQGYLGFYVVCIFSHHLAIWRQTIQRPFILALEATVFVIESVAMVEVHERLS